MVPQVLTESMPGVLCARSLRTPRVKGSGPWKWNVEHGTGVVVVVDVAVVVVALVVVVVARLSTTVAPAAATNVTAPSSTSSNTSVFSDTARSIFSATSNTAAVESVSAKITRNEDDVSPVASDLAAALIRRNRSTFSPSDAALPIPLVSSFDPDPEARSSSFDPDAASSNSVSSIVNVLTHTTSRTSSIWIPATAATVEAMFPRNFF